MCFSAILAKRASLASPDFSIRSFMLASNESDRLNSYANL